MVGMNPWARNKQGFTIVELLIVIVVIAILAAITIVSYTGVQRQAQLASVQSGLSNFGKKMELYKVENGVYLKTGENSAWRAMIEETLGVLSDAGTNNALICRTSEGDKYALARWAPFNPSPGGTVYYVSSNSSGASSAIWPGQESWPSIGSSVCALILPGSGATWTQSLY